MTTTNNETTGTTTDDAYEMGCYVGRHGGKQGAKDRERLAAAWPTGHPLKVAYLVGLEHGHLSTKRY